jgi:hypothetical protein
MGSVGRASQGAEKLKYLSFRGTLRAEESLILLTLEPREIPHFVRNDSIAYFFRSLFSLSCFHHSPTMPLMEIE